MVEYDNNEYKPAFEMQNVIASECVETKSNVPFILKNEKTNQDFKAICYYVNAKSVIFENIETKKRRKAVLSI